MINTWRSLATQSWLTRGRRLGMKLTSNFVWRSARDLLTEEPADSSDDGNICNTKTFCRKKRAEEKKTSFLISWENLMVNPTPWTLQGPPRNQVAWKSILGFEREYWKNCRRRVRLKIRVARKIYHAIQSTFKVFKSCKSHMMLIILNILLISQAGWWHNQL